MVFVIVSIDTPISNCYMELSNSAFPFDAVCVERSKSKCRMMAVTQIVGSRAEWRDSRTISIPASVRPLGLRQKRIKAPEAFLLSRSSLHPLTD
jgi:hypothetical protein